MKFSGDRKSQSYTWWKALFKVLKEVKDFLNECSHTTEEILYLVNTAKESLLNVYKPFTSNNYRLMEIHDQIYWKIISNEEYVHGTYMLVFMCCVPGAQPSS